MAASRLVDDQGGVALPMALLTLALLTSLMLALASISAMEPVIAANHLQGSQARALAESGLEYALWALAHPTSPGGLPAGRPAAAPFDGRTFVAFGPGGFTVSVADDAGGDPQRRLVTVVGWVPTNSPTDSRPRAQRRLSTQVAAVPPLGLRAPCAVCVRGALDLVGPVAVDGHNRDPACGDDAKFASFSRDATTLTGPVARTGGAGPEVQHRPAADFDPIVLSPAALEALKTLAWRAGTYYGPGFPRGGTVFDGSPSWSARLVFDAANPLPDGVVFVDTADARDLDTAGGLTPAITRLEPGALDARGGAFRGWLVVNGTLEIAERVHAQGLVYAVDGLSYQAAGASRIDGLVVALNTRNAGPIRLDATAGSLTITFDCRLATGASLIPRGYVPIPGTYRED
jgi:hypothetical protein